MTESLVSEIQIEHFDLGMVLMTGATLYDVVLDGMPRKMYTIVVSRVNGPEAYGRRVPVFFAGGDMNFTPAHYPSVVIKQTSLERDDSRMVGWSLESVVRSKFAEDVEFEDQYGVVRRGVNKLQLKARSIPYKITYEIEVVARGNKAREEAQLILRHLTRTFTPDGIVFVAKDAAGDERTYDATVELDSGEYNYLDLSMREHKRVIRVVVDGEIDFYEPFDVDVVSSPPLSTITRM